MTTEILARSTRVNIAWGHDAGYVGEGVTDDAPNAGHEAPAGTKPDVSRPLGGSKPQEKSENSAPAAPSIAGSATWSLVGQVVPMAFTIFLTPYILHGLGVVRYGLFVLVGSLVNFLGTFDGGIKGTAQRYFGVYAGQGDVRKSTELLFTLLIVISAFGIVVSTVGWFVAPTIVSVIDVPIRYRPESIFLFRTLGVLLTFSFIHNLFVSILQAHFRFAYIIKAGFGIYVLWASGLILTVHYKLGLRGVALVFIALQVFLTVVIMPASLRYVNRGDIGLLSRKEIRTFLSFSGRVQISSLSGLVNAEFDAIIIGAVLKARAVTFYNSGSNFGENIGGILVSALSPVQTALANTFGREGEEAAFQQFVRIQRVWVIGLCGWYAAAGGASYFAIVTWLGPQFSLGGSIAIVAVLTSGVFLLSGVLRAYCSVSGRPGIQSRFGVFSMVINIVFTVPLVFTGAIGVAAATGIAQVAGTLYLVRLANKELPPTPESMLKAVPVIATISTAVIVTALELMIRSYLPQGGVGLIACGGPALIGLVFYGVAMLGPRQFFFLLSHVRRDARSNGARAAIIGLITAMAA